MKVMSFSFVFLLEIHVTDLARTICDARLICLEINLERQRLDKGICVRILTS